MHDLKRIRDNSESFDLGLKRRGLPPSSEAIIRLDSSRRQMQTALQEMQAKRNDLSKQIGEVKRQKGNAESLMNEVAVLKDKISDLEGEEKKIAETLDDLLSRQPNTPSDSVPDGVDERDNKEIRRYKEPVKNETAKEHFDVGEALGLMDFETAALLSGARFTVLKGALARLERALGNFMLDTHTEEFGYLEVSPPLLVKDPIMFGTAQLPKFRDDQFFALSGYQLSSLQEGKFDTKDGWWLIPTAEVPLTNLVRDRILNRDELPYRFTAKTACFRSEAGSAGKDTRGMLRQHQFYKVELVSITAPSQSQAEHERMTSCAESILKKLELPFRTIVLCTGDMGFASQKTYDVEVWMPGQKTYREISSCSNCGDFQARRMNARCRSPNEKTTEYVHTLNGSGIAVGRCLIAIIENYQNSDGSVTIPPVLRTYMGGVESIQLKVSHG